MTTVSIVSHGHGHLIPDLVEMLLGFQDVKKIIVTKNIPEDFYISDTNRVKLLENSSPLGFGSNHNAAFRLSEGAFCVLNPDVNFYEDPFPRLLRILNEPRVGLVAPLVKNETGQVQDSVRRYPTPQTMIRRVFTRGQSEYEINENAERFSPDWVAGMFMLFHRTCYEEVAGFDEKFFLYCEDVDICARIRQKKYRLILEPSVSIQHIGARMSKKRLSFLSLHIKSMLRLYLKYKNGYPR